MALLNYSQSLGVGQPRDVNVLVSRYNEIRSVVNALTNVNIDAAAGIDPAKINLANAIGTGELGSRGVTMAKIAAGAAGQMVVCDGSGNPQYAAMSGDASLSSAGAVSLVGGVAPGRRTIAEGAGYLYGGLSSGEYLLGSATSGGSISRMDKAGNDIILDGERHIPPILVPIFASDYVAGSKTPKLRVRTSVATNGTAPGVTVWAGIYKVTLSGTTNKIRYGVSDGMAGTVVTPAANTVTADDSAEFALPADGWYVLVAALSAAPAANSAFSVHAALQQYWV